MSERAGGRASGRAGGRRRGWRRRKTRPSRRQSHPEKSATILRGGVWEERNADLAKGGAGREDRVGGTSIPAGSARRPAGLGLREGRGEAGGRACVGGRARSAPPRSPLAPLRLDRRRGDRRSQARRCRHLERLGAWRLCSLRPSRCASGWAGERTESRPRGAPCPEAPGRAAVCGG